MTRCHFALLAAVAVLAAPAALPAEPAKVAPVRKLLYPPERGQVPQVLKPHVERLLAADQKPIDPAAATCGGVYARILSKQYAIDAGKLKAGGWLGSRPFVFLTVPEVAYGRDLLGVLAAIGYDLEDILEIEKGVEKVAVVFTFPEKVKTCDATDGALPDAWAERVYPTTWNNTLGLIDRMAADKARWVVTRPDGDGFVPTKLQLRSEKELSFLLGFPDEGKKRVSTTDYAALREVGGSDWVYRQLIERLIGASEHFRGDGKTKLTLAGRRKPRAGFPEFLGPNTELKDLPAVAVVSLGTLRIEE
jgi:hypothetical protein